MRFYKDRAAVLLRTKPSELVRNLYGSARGAATKLGIDKNSFHRWDRNNRIPYSVYQRLLAEFGEIASEVQSIVRMDTRPFKVPYALKPALALKMGKASKTPKDSPVVKPVAKKPTTTATSSSATISSRSPRLADQVSALERENARLRKTLANIRQTIADIS